MGDQRNLPNRVLDMSDCVSPLTSGMRVEEAVRFLRKFRVDKDLDIYTNIVSVTLKQAELCRRRYVTCCTKLPRLDTILLIFDD